MSEYKDQGYLADALFNYLVRLGWSHGDQEIFTQAELIEYFDLDHVGKTGAIFDIKKLKWLNGHYMRGKTPQELLEACGHIAGDFKERLAGAWDTKTLSALIELYKERATTLFELTQSILALAQAPKKLDLACIQKWHTPQLGKVLEAYQERIAGCCTFSHDILLAAAKQLCEEYDIKLVQLAQPLRLALTGGIVSPGIFDLITLVGKEESCARIAALIECIEQAGQTNTGQMSASRAA